MSKPRAAKGVGACFQVKWVESAFERGSLTGREHWTGILTFVTKVPTTADALRKNPLGIFVDAIDWSRELEPVAATPPVAAPTETVVPPPPTSIVGQPALDPEVQP